LLDDGRPSDTHRANARSGSAHRCPAIAKGVGDTPVPFLLREPPQRRPAIACCHATCGDWLAAACTETLRAVSAVAGAAHETARGSISCSRLLSYPSFFPFFAHSFFPTIGRSSGGPSPSFVPHPPCDRGCQEVSAGGSTLTYTPARKVPLGTRTLPELPGTSTGPACNRPCHFLNSQGPGCLSIKHPSHYIHAPNAPSRLKPPPW
jgi:hypothetical protein